MDDWKVGDRVWNSVVFSRDPAWDSVENSVEDSVWEPVGEYVMTSVRNSVWGDING